MAKFSGEDGKCLHGATATITNATHDTGVVTVTTSAAHGFVATDRVAIASIVGMTDLNATFVLIAAPTTTTFTVTLTTEQSYSSGGTARKIVPITEFTVTESSGSCNVTDSGSAGVVERIPNGYLAAEGTFVGLLLDGVKGPVRGTTIALRLELDSSNYYTVTGVVDSVGTALVVAEESAIVQSYTFKGVGALSETL